MTLPFLGHQALFGAVPESTYGTTPSPGTIGALANAFVFESETIAKRGKIVERAGMRGTRSHVADDARTGPYTVAGQIKAQFTPVDLAFWWQFILGGAPAGGVYGLAETLPSLTLGFARGVKKFRYTGCCVSKATLTGSQGQLLDVTLEIVGQAEVVETTGWPSIAPDTTAPYIFSDLALTIDSVPREVHSFQLTIDNRLIADRFMNSTTIVNAPAGDRVIGLRTEFAWAAENVDLYDVALAGLSGATLTLSGSGHSDSLAFGLLQAPALSPTAASRAENLLTVDWSVRKTGATSELVVTHT